LLDGLVVARSTFESSMNYRSAMVLGTARKLTGAAKLAALQQITEHLLPGRWPEARQPNKKELAATMVLSLSLAEASVKMRVGPPDDDPNDLEWPAWAGSLPLRESFGEPVPAPDLVQPYPVPDYVRSWTRPTPTT